MEILGKNKLSDIIQKINGDDEKSMGDSKIRDII
jgi:hypothetical protein